MTDSFALKRLRDMAGGYEGSDAVVSFSPIDARFLITLALAVKDADQFAGAVGTLRGSRTCTGREFFALLAQSDTPTP